MKKRVLTVLSITLIIAVTIFPSVAFAATASNFNLRSMGNYYWYNYDFNSQSATYDNVDWPMSLIFWGDDYQINVSTAKLCLWNYSNASTMYAKYYDSGEGIYEWDSDEGRKSNMLLDLNDWHARLYADIDTGQCTNPSWGYYVIASSHRDYLLSLEYGHTNDANVEVCNQAATVVGPVISNRISSICGTTKLIVLKAIQSISGILMATRKALICPTFGNVH